MLVQQRWAIPEPPSVERANSTALTLFLTTDLLLTVCEVSRKDTLTHSIFYIMLKRLLPFALLLLTCGFVRSAAQEVTSGNLRFEIEEREYGDGTTSAWATVVGYVEEPVGQLNIPSSVTYEGKEYKVTDIETEGFCNCQQITSINIPSTVSLIRGCRDYEHSDAIFYGCDNLEEINVDYDGGFLYSVDGVLFYDTSLIRYPSAKKGSSYVIPSTVNLKGEDYDVDLAIDAVRVYAFSGSKYLESVTFPAEFSNLSAYGVFEECTSLTSVVFPTSVKNFPCVLGRGWFLGCTALKSIEIPEPIEEIEDEAFILCTSLESIILPSTLKVFAPSAIYVCSSLKTIYSHAVVPPACDSDMYYDEDFVLYVPKGCVEAYKAAKGWREMMDIREFEAGIDDIVTESSANADVYDLRGVKIPNTEKVPHGLYIINGQKVLK